MLNSEPTIGNTRVSSSPSEGLITLVGTHRGNIAEAEKLVEEHREEVIAEERPKIEKWQCLKEKPRPFS